MSEDFPIVTYTECLSRLQQYNFKAYLLAPWLYKFMAPAVRETALDVADSSIMTPAIFSAGALTNGFERYKRDRYIIIGCSTPAFE